MGSEMRWMTDEIYRDSIQMKKVKWATATHNIMDETSPTNSLLSELMF